MKAITLFTLIILANSSALFSQSGYFGRKVIVEIGALGRLPMVYNGIGADPNYYENVNGSLRVKSNNFDFGFMGGVSLLSKKAVSFALYGGIYSTENKAGSYYDYGTYDIDNEYVSVQKMESFKLRTINIQPTLIISNERFTKPAGLSHEIGLGFQLSSIVPNDYLIIADEPSQQALLDANQHLVYNKEAKYRAVGLNYTLKIKKPISDRLFFSYGLRYNLTIGNKYDQDVHKTANYSYNGVETYVRKSLNQQYINLFAGFAFML